MLYEFIKLENGRTAICQQEPITTKDNKEFLFVHDGQLYKGIYDRITAKISGLLDAVRGRRIGSKLVHSFDFDTIYYVVDIVGSNPDHSVLELYYNQAGKSQFINLHTIEPQQMILDLIVIEYKCTEGFTNYQLKNRIELYIRKELHFTIRGIKEIFK